MSNLRNLDELRQHAAVASKTSFAGLCTLAVALVVSTLAGDEATEVRERAAKRIAPIAPPALEGVASRVLPFPFTGVAERVAPQSIEAAGVVSFGMVFGSALDRLASVELGLAQVDGASCGRIAWRELLAQAASPKGKVATVKELEILIDGCAADPAAVKRLGELAQGLLAPENPNLKPGTIVMGFRPTISRAQAQMAAAFRRAVLSHPAHGWPSDLLSRLAAMGDQEHGSGAGGRFLSEYAQRRAAASLSPNALVAAIDRHLQAGEISRALEAFDQAFARFPEGFPSGSAGAGLLVKIARLKLARAGSGEASRSTVRQCLDILLKTIEHCGDVFKVGLDETLMEVGRRLEEQKLPDEAAVAYRAALEKLRKSYLGPEAAERLVALYGQGAELPDPFAFVDMLRERTAVNPRIYLAMARLYRALGRFSDAADAYSRYAARFPDTPQAKQALVELAEAHVQQGNARGALEVYSAYEKQYGVSQMPEQLDGLVTWLALADSFRPGRVGGEPPSFEWAGAQAGRLKEKWTARVERVRARLAVPAPEMSQRIPSSLGAASGLEAMRTAVVPVGFAGLGAASELRPVEPVASERLTLARKALAPEALLLADTVEKARSSVANRQAEVYLQEAEVLRRKNDFAPALRKYESALDLAPSGPTFRRACLGAASLSLQVQDSGGARRFLEDAVRDAPDSREADQARQMMQKIP